MGRSDVGITGGASGANAGAGLGPARYFGAWVDLVRCRKTAFLVAGSVDEAHARNRICNAGQVESCCIGRQDRAWRRRDATVAVEDDRQPDAHIQPDLRGFGLRRIEMGIITSLQALPPSLNLLCLS